MLKNQHGDVLMKTKGSTLQSGGKFEGIPADAVPVKGSRVLAEGETTGHMHVLEGTSAELLKQGDRLFARVLSGDCSVIHDEHKRQTVLPGEYEIEIVREYDHLAEEARAVRD